MATRITPLPTPVPQSSDPENFDPRADEFLTALPTFADEANLVADEMDEAVDTAQSAATASLSNAGFVGRWEDQSGSAAPPYAVFHGGLFWSLLEAVADVTASEPDPYNLQWAVTGAPSWYNNFAVGDFLDTARDMGPGWLKRDGSSYPVSSFPELAPLFPKTQEGFAWDVKDTGSTHPVRAIVRISATDLIAIASDTENPSLGTDILGSSDNGASWSLVTTVASFAGSALVRNPSDGTLVMGGAARSYCSSTDDGASWSSPATMPSLHSSAVIHTMLWFEGAYFAVASGDRGQQAYVMRSETPSGWASVHTIPNRFPGDFPQPFCFWEGDGRLYVAHQTATSQPRYAVSNSSGTTFTEQELVGGACPIGGAYTGEKDVSRFYVIGDISSLLIRSTLDGLAWTEAYSRSLPRPLATRGSPGAYADGTLVIPLEEKTVVLSDAAATLYDLYDIPGFAFTENGAQEKTFVKPDLSPDGKIVMFAGTGGKIARGVLIETEFFRVPDDNPSTGWIKAVSDSPGTVGYTGVPEAPMTGDDYVRNNGMWKIPSGGGGGGMVYPDAGVAISTGSGWDDSKDAPTGDIVGTTDAQTLTNKTFGGGTKESTTTASSVAITNATAPVSKITITSNHTASVSIDYGVSKTVDIDPGAYTVTWPSNIDWLGGSAPTLTTGKFARLEFSGSPVTGRVDGALIWVRP